MDIDQVQEKIQKLLRLAEGTNNPEEAGAAMAMANRLMVQYKIEKINLGESIEEKFVQGMLYQQGTRRKVWLDSLGTIVGQHFGVVVAIYGKNTLVYGKQSNIDTFKKLYFFCQTEIDRLTIIHATGKGKSFANSFRHGAVKAIKDSLEEERNKLAQENVHSRALMVINNEYSDALGKLSDMVGSIKNRTATMSANSGYAYGYQAGKSIHRKKNGRIEC